MAEINSTSAKLSDELSEIVRPAITVRALLQGAMSLLDEATHLDDRNGDIFAARTLVAEAFEKIAEVYGDKETRLLSRLIAIDRVAA